MSVRFGMRFALVVNPTGTCSCPASPIPSSNNGGRSEQAIQKWLPHYWT